MGGLIEGVRTAQLAAIVGKHLIAERLKADALEKTGGNDPIGIDVITAQCEGRPADLADFTLGEAAGRGHERREEESAGNNNSVMAGCLKP
jgi:hypothetical protein